VQNLGFPYLEPLQIKENTNQDPCFGLICSGNTVPTKTSPTLCACAPKTPPKPPEACNNTDKPCPAGQLCFCSRPSGGTPGSCKCTPR
jgi:hypothetical protein